MIFSLKFGNRKKDIYFVILSKDKGFDPLIKHMRKSNINCQRIQSLTELSKEKDASVSNNRDSITKIMANLAKIQKQKRPKTRKTLRQHIKALLSQQKLSEKEIDKLINTIFMQKKVSESSKKLTYNF